MKIARLIAHLIVVFTAIVGLEAVAVAQPNAEELYAEGKAAYDRGDYVAAVEKWQASYDASKENDLLFNLAQAKRLASDCVGALATYRRFVTGDVDPSSEQHKLLAEEWSRELEVTCPASSPKPRPIPTVVHQGSAEAGSSFQAQEQPGDRKIDVARSGHTWIVAGLVTGGVGVVTLAIGLGIGYHGAAIGDEITAACRMSCDWETLKDKDARGRREVAIGKALDVGGVAAIAGGAIFYYLGVREDSATVAVAPRDGGAVVSWSGLW